MAEKKNKKVAKPKEVETPEVIEEVETPGEKPERYRVKKGYPTYYYKYGVIDHEWRELDGYMPDSMEERIKAGYIELESEVN